MKYQLVLQWPAVSIEDYDYMIEIEQRLRETLGDDSHVDGHDAGTGEMNIFIHTDDPVAAFAEIRAMLGTRDFWNDARVAYREIAKDKYRVLWPTDLTEFKVT